MHNSSLNWLIHPQQHSLTQTIGLRFALAKCDTIKVLALTIKIRNFIENEQQQQTTILASSQTHTHTPTHCCERKQTAASLVHNWGWCYFTIRIYPFCVAIMAMCCVRSCISHTRRVTFTIKRDANHKESHIQRSTFKMRHRMESMKHNQIEWPNGKSPQN